MPRFAYASAAVARAVEQAAGPRAAAPCCSRSRQQQQNGGLLGGKRALAAAQQALALACLLGLLGAAAGSPGDQSRPFQRCTAQCRHTGCASLAALPAAGGATGSSLPAAQQCSPLCKTGSVGSGGRSTGSARQAPPPVLRLWRWDCSADCSYLCMWQLEDSWRQAGTPPQKYYGKWPFARLAGMQEPASVIFSLLNLAAHAHCLVRYRRLCRTLPMQRDRRAQRGVAGQAASAAGNDVTCKGSAGKGGGSEAGSEPADGPGPYPYAWLWQGYMLLSINAWLWSAVFHGRDTPLTERFDYFSAALLIFFNLFLSVVRVCGLRAPAMLVALAVPLLLFLFAHFRYMLLVLFDYGYHVKVCIVAGAAQSLLWLLWGLRATPRTPGRSPLLAFILLVNACMTLEVLDFPPILSTLDAHALWHAGTVPLVYLFYSFIQADTATWPGAAKAKRA